MADNDNSEILARIEQRLEAVGMSERAASIEATGGAHAIRNMRKGSKPGIDVFTKLAGVLDTTPEWLAFGVKGPTSPADVLAEPNPSYVPFTGHNSGLPIISKVAAGRWLEVNTDVDAPLYGDVLVPPDPNYDPGDQFAVEVAGTSINRIARSGSILVCLDVKKARINVENNDLVIVEQRRAGGLEIMRTAKIFRRNADTIEFWPVSDDPKWQEPIVIDTDEEPEEGVSIDVIGLVTWIQRPVSLPDPSDRSEVARGRRRRSFL